MLYYLVLTVYVIVCLALMMVVLLQQGKGGDIASAFGGGGSQTAFGARAGATVLTRATAVLGGLFMVGAVVLSIIGRPGAGSLMRGVNAPPVQTAPPVAPVAQPPLEPTKPAPAPQQQPTTLPQPEQAKPSTQKPGGPPK